MSNNTKNFYLSGKEGSLEDINSSSSDISDISDGDFVIEEEVESSDKKGKGGKKNRKRKSSVKDVLMKSYQLKSSNTIHKKYTNSNLDDDYKKLSNLKIAFVFRKKDPLDKRRKIKRGGINQSKPSSGYTTSPYDMSGLSNNDFYMKVNWDNNTLDVMDKIAKVNFGKLFKESKLNNFIDNILLFNNTKLDVYDKDSSVIGSLTTKMGDVYKNVGLTYSAFFWGVLNQNKVKVDEGNVNSMDLIGKTAYGMETTVEKALLGRIDVDITKETWYKKIKDVNIGVAVVVDPNVTNTTSLKKLGTIIGISESHSYFVNKVYIRK